MEWVAFHRALGFEDVLIFTNDCEDGSDTIADRLSELGLATHVRNDGPFKRGPQWDALNSDPLKMALEQSDWAIHLDIDEFLNIKTGNRQLDDLKDEIGDIDAISIPWRFFGNAGIADFSDQPVTSQFTKCGPYPLMFPRNCLMFKTLFRPSEQLNRAGVHTPRPAKDSRSLRWLNGDGRQVDTNFDPRRPVLHGANFGNTLAQINHYALKSKASFLVKAARGLPNHTERPIDLDYWVRRNFNDKEDTSLAERETPALQDSDLEKLHNQSCDWHAAKAAEILMTQKGAELYSAISVAGDTRSPPDTEIRKIYDALGKVYG